MERACVIQSLAGRSVTKMNGIGNAILVLDLRGTDIILTPEAVRAVAAQPRLAFDQFMVLHDPRGAGTNAFMRIYNSDGSAAGACGNGTRCVAALLMAEGCDEIVLATAAGRLACRRLPDGRISVDMGAPHFDAAAIPVAAGLDPRAIPLDAALPAAFALGMGNPHAVFFVDDLAALDLAALGPRLETAPAFPDRANISFAQVLDRGTIRLRVWERGAGATLACGSAACATLVAAAETGRTGRAAAIDLPGGRLDIVWHADGHVLMTGPVAFEFAAILDSAALESIAAVENVTAGQAA